jgi:Uma2 family endonuclease
VKRNSGCHAPLPLTAGSLCRLPIVADDSPFLVGEPFGWGGGVVFCTMAISLSEHKGNLDMSTLTTRPPNPSSVAAPIDTLADLMKRLGGVPLDRVRFHPPPGTAVEQDVLNAENEGLLCELVDGVLVEKAMGYSESILAVFLIEVLNAFVRTRNLGLVSGPDGTMRLFPGLVRIPDVAFVSWNRLPGKRRPNAKLPTLAPDLAVEVLSESNTKTEMKRKRHDYFSVGVRLVWLADPKTRTVDVYTSEKKFTHLTETDILDGGRVLPGFHLAVREWFAELDRHG